MSAKKSNTNTKLPTKNWTQDKFTLYTVVVVILVLCGLAFFIYHARTSGRVEGASTYVELKQSIVNDSGVVARLSVTIQVAAGDEDWLKKNQAALNANFNKELSTTDVSTLRTTEGKLELQEELKRKFNLLLKTDKVQAVMVTELLMQDQRND